MKIIDYSDFDIEKFKINDNNILYENRFFLLKSPNLEIAEDYQNDHKLKIKLFDTTYHNKLFKKHMEDINTRIFLTSNVNSINIEKLVKILELKILDKNEKNVIYDENNNIVKNLEKNLKKFSKCILLLNITLKGINIVEIKVQNNKEFKKINLSKN